MSMSDDEFLKTLKAFAKTISSQRYGLIPHKPELSAAVNGCYINTEQKVNRAGGSIQYGWMFIHRFTKDFPSVGYFMAIHHAVWKNPMGHLIDVTPFHPEVRHQPINENAHIYFLADDKAKPAQLSNGDPAPLPIKYFPLNNGKKLAAYVDQLRANEEINCREQHELMEKLAKENTK